MNRFACPLRLDLAACPADFLLLAAFAALALLTCFGASPPLAAALVPLFVAQVTVCWSRLAEPRWSALKLDGEGSWQALDRRGRWQDVAVNGNFWCRAVVVLSIRGRRARQHHALWRHREPDCFRGLLSRIHESRDA